MAESLNKLSSLGIKRMILQDVNQGMFALLHDPLFLILTTTFVTLIANSMTQNNGQLSKRLLRQYAYISLVSTGLITLLLYFLSYALAIIANLIHAQKWLYLLSVTVTVLAIIDVWLISKK